jgi:heat shock protein HtpX
MTGKPMKLASALTKISGRMKGVPTKDLRQVESLNAFFILPAISGESIMNLFSTHPPVEARIKRLMEMEAAMA